MNAQEVIEAYVTDVAALLPRKQRNDVAFELRALLNEDLDARAEAADRAPDAAMATELLRAFGRPSEVAARYRPTLTVIDPVDGHAFLRIAWIGLAVIWILGLFVHVSFPIASGSELLLGIGRWWSGTVVPSLWWPGVLVVGFGISAWVRQRWPQTAEWTPRAPDHLRGGRAAVALALFGMICGYLVLIFPLWLFEAIFDGRVAPALRDSFTYTDRFLQRQAPWMLGLMLANVLLWLAVMIQGRWPPLLRHVETVLSLIFCAVMFWTVFDGPVFVGTASDQTARFFLLVIALLSLVLVGMSLYRKVRPGPDRGVR